MEARVVDAETRAEIAEEKVSVFIHFPSALFALLHGHNLESELHSSPRPMEMGCDEWGEVKGSQQQSTVTSWTKWALVWFDGRGVSLCAEFRI